MTPPCLTASGSYTENETRQTYGYSTVFVVRFVFCYMKRERGSVMVYPLLFGALPFLLGLNNSFDCHLSCSYPTYVTLAVYP